MSRARHHSNLAARMGRWSATHWKTATFGWLVLVVVAFAVGSQVGTKQVDPNTAGPGESGRMDRILDAGFKLPADESVLIQSRSVRAGAPAFDAAVADVVARVSKEAAVQNVRSPLDPANVSQIAKGRRAALSSSRSEATRTRRATSSARSSRASPTHNVPIRASSWESSAVRARRRPSTRHSRTTSRARACFRSRSR